MGNSFQNTSSIIAATRFPLAFMVVVIHARTLDESLSTIDINNLGGMDFALAFQTLFSKTICPVAVPTFYVISGFLFFYNISSFSWTTYLSKLKKRVYSLAIPYFLWNAVWIFWLTAKETIKSMRGGGEGTLQVATGFLKGNMNPASFWDCSSWSQGANWLGEITSTTGPVLIPMWFIRDLMVVIVLTPVICFLLRKYPKVYLLILACCYTTGIWPDIHGFSAVSLLFFSLGAYFSIHGKDMIGLINKYRLASFICYLPLTIVMLYDQGPNGRLGDIANTIYTLVGVFALFNILALLSGKRVGKWLESMQGYTFFVYGAHSFLGFAFANVILRAVAMCGISEWLDITACYLLRPILAVLACILVQQILGKLSPLVLNILTGRKIK